MHHLFVDCNFTKEIWILILKDLNCDVIWEGGQVSDCILNWKRRKGESIEIAGLIYSRNIETLLFLKIVLLIETKFVQGHYRYWEK